MEAISCHCTRRPSPIDDHCDCIEARVHAAELTSLFNLRWKADMNAIRRWQEAHPDRALTWPDHADMVVWLMEQLDAERGPWKGVKGRVTNRRLDQRLRANRPEVP